MQPEGQQPVPQNPTPPVAGPMPPAPGMPDQPPAPMPPAPAGQPGDPWGAPAAPAPSPSPTPGGQPASPWGAPAAPSPMGPSPMDHNPMGGAPTTPMPSMGMPHAGVPGGGNRKKLFMVVAFAVLGVLLLGTIAAVAMKMMGGSVKLETFSNENLSVLVPTDYKKTPENGGASFEEQKGASGTHSEVVAFYESLPSGLSDSDIQQVKTSLRSLLQNAAESSATQSDQEIKNIKITDIKFKGDDALKLTGDAVRDGKTVGHYTLIAGINKKAVYMVGVGVHKSDPGLSKKVDQILNSFTLK